MSPAKLTMAALCILTLMACAAAPTPIPEPQSEGAQRYRDRCGVCHALPHPKRHSAQGWDQVLTLMTQRMAERNVPPLIGEDRELIRAYLQRNAK